MPAKYYLRLALCVLSLASLLASGCGGPSDGRLGSGKIKIPSYTVTAPASGKILGLIIAKGERITKDQPLFAIADPKTDGEEKNLAGELAKAEAELKRLESGTAAGISPASLAALQADFDAARQKAAKMNNLLAMGAVSRNQARAAQTEMQQAAAALQAASQQAAAVRPSTPETIAAQKEKVKQLQQQHQAALLKQQTNEAASPATGIITEKLLENNAEAAKGQPVLKLKSTESCSVVFSVPAAAAKDLSPGREVYFSAKGLPAPFTGRITGVRGTEVSAASDNKPEDLADDTEVTVSLAAK